MTQLGKSILDTFLIHSPFYLFILTLQEAVANHSISYDKMWRNIFLYIKFIHDSRFIFKKTRRLNQLHWEIML